MKKYFLIGILLLIAFGGIAQWTKPNNSYGVISNRASIDSTILLPTGCGTPTSLKAVNLKKAAYYCDSCGHASWIYDPMLNQWRKLVDTTYTGFAKNRIDVFLIAGQSNAKGMGSSSLSPTTTSGTVYQYNYGTNLTPGNDPVGSGSSQSNTGSAWPAFGITYYNLTGVKVCFVAAAKNSTAQTAAADAGSGNWDTTGTLFDTSIARINAALTYLSASGYTPIFKGVLWCQGENDALSINATTITQAAYIAAFQKMIKRYKISLGAKIPIYIFRTGTETDVSDAGFASIRAAQQTVSTSYVDSSVKIVFWNAINFQSRSLMGDVVHYTQAGYNEMGRIGAENVVNASGNIWQTQAGNIYTNRSVGIGDGNIVVGVPPNTLYVNSSSNGIPLRVITTSQQAAHFTSDVDGIGGIRIENLNTGVSAGSGERYYNNSGIGAQIFLGSSNYVLGGNLFFVHNNVGSIRMSTGNEVQFADNSHTVHSKITAGHHFLVNTTTDVGNHYLIVNGAASVYDTLFNAGNKYNSALPSLMMQVIDTLTGAQYHQAIPSGGGSGLTIGTTSISSGTNTRILYNNSGTLGEYSVTGTGTVVVMQTSPSISTSLLTGSSTFSLFNSTATTVNAFGAATTLNIGANAGTVLNFGGSTSAAELRFLEPSGSGTNYTAFKAQAQSANITYTLPASDAVGALTSNGSGSLSFVPYIGLSGTYTLTGATNIDNLGNKRFALGDVSNTNGGVALRLWDDGKAYALFNGTSTNAFRPYKVWTGTLTQSGTDDPVATVLENTLGGTIVWTRNSSGDYSGTLSGAFTSGKTWTMSNMATLNGNDIDIRVKVYRSDDNTISIESADSGTSLVELEMSGGKFILPIEIRVYF